MPVRSKIVPILLLLVAVVPATAQSCPDSQCYIKFIASSLCKRAQYKDNCEIKKCSSSSSIFGSNYRCQPKPSPSPTPSPSPSPTPFVPDLSKLYYFKNKVNGDEKCLTTLVTNGEVVLVACADDIANHQKWKFVATSFEDGLYTY